MNKIEAIKCRQSVRQYLKKSIEAEKVELLNAKIEELNAEGNIRMVLLEDAGNTYNRLLNKAMGLGSAPSVIACFGPDDSTLAERIGYYGEELVLYAQQLGLNTCWTGTFNRKALADKLREGEKLSIAIAIGYGKTQGRIRKSKTARQVTEVKGERPEWFDFAVEMALLAPTAINQQHFEISLIDGEVGFKDKGGILSDIDLGIVKRHFDIGVEYFKEAE